jgi:hypothetical protein
MKGKVTNADHLQHFLKLSVSTEQLRSHLSKVTNDRLQAGEAVKWSTLIRKRQSCDEEQN